MLKESVKAVALSAEQRERYARQLVLPQLGAHGQAQLAAACVSIVGVGGLGSTVAQSLAGAGVGQLQLIDPDPLERSNLHRQLLYREPQLGKYKVDAASEQLLGINSLVSVVSRKQRLTVDNADKSLSGSHVVVDGSDNFVTRYAINQACARLGIPWVYGAAEALEGQLSVFWPARGGACYECLYPREAAAPEGGCALHGVLGMLPAIIGQLQALEVIKLLTGLGENLCGQLVSFNGLTGSFRRSRYRRDPNCPCTCWDAVPIELPIDLRKVSQASD